MSSYNEIENKLRFDLFFHISRSIHNRIDSEIIRLIDSRITNKAHRFTRQFQNNMREHMKSFFKELYRINLNLT